MLRTKLQKKTESSNSDPRFFDKLLALTAWCAHVCVPQNMFYVELTCYMLVL